MFGKDAPTLEQVSEDEDWGPGRRKRRKKESDAANTLMTLHESEKKCSNNEQNHDFCDGATMINRKLHSAALMPAHLSL